MKRKQGISFLLALMLLVALLAGCSFLSSGSSTADTPAPEKTAEQSSAAVPEQTRAPAAPEAPQEPAVKPVDWSGIYRDFLLGGGYLTSGQTYDDGNPRFGLYDLDQNGVPELLATRGALAMVDHEQYVYTIENNAVRFLGTAGMYETGFDYAYDSRYPGLFNTWVHTGSGGVSYLTLVNGVYKETEVLEYHDGAEFTYTQLTDDDALYQFARSFYYGYGEINPSDGNRLPMYPISDIESMGWDTFAGSF